MSAMNGDARRKLAILALKLGLSVGLIALVVTGNREAFQDAAATRPNLGLLALALVLYLSGVTLAFARWHRLVRALDLPFSLRESFRLGWIGMFFNLVIPGAVGGDFVKAAYLARSQHYKARAVASVVIDRLVGLIGLFVLAAAGAAFAWNRLDPRIRPIAVSAWIALGVTVAITFAAVRIQPHGPLSKRLANRPKLRHLLLELHAAGVAYRSRSTTVFFAVALAALTHCLNVLAFISVGAAFAAGGGLPPIDGFFTIVPLVLFSTAIPLPFSGLGAAEGVSALLFQALDYRGGAVAMIGFRLLQMTAALIGCGYYLAHRSRITTPSQPGAPMHAHAPHDTTLSAPTPPPVSASTK